MTKENNIRTGEVTQLRRIADALEEVIRLVKQDQEKFERYKEETTEKWEPGLCK
jgi:lipopolysaccharide biosynthesis glycosyltransferase